MTTKTAMVAEGCDEELVDMMLAARVAKGFIDTEPPISVRRLAHVTGLTEDEVGKVLAMPVFAKFCQQQIESYTSAAMLPAVQTVIKLLSSTKETVQLRAAEVLSKIQLSAMKVAEVRDEQREGVEELINLINFKVKDASTRTDPTDPPAPEANGD